METDNQRVNDIIQELAFKRRRFPEIIKDSLVEKYEADLQVLQMAKYPSCPVDHSALLSEQLDRMDEILQFMDDEKEHFAIPLSQLSSPNRQRKPVEFTARSSYVKKYRCEALMSSGMDQVDVRKAVEPDNFSGDSDDQILTGHGLVPPTSVRPKDRVVKRRTSTPLAVQPSASRRDKSDNASRNLSSTPTTRTPVSRIPVASPSRRRGSQYNQPEVRSPSRSSSRLSKASPAVSITQLRPRSSKTPQARQSQDKPSSIIPASPSVTSKSNVRAKKSVGRSPTRKPTDSTSKDESPTAAAFRPRRIKVMHTP